MNNALTAAAGFYDRALSMTKRLEPLGPLAIRLYLAPVFIIAGYNKLQLSDDSLGFWESLTANPGVVSWFGNPDWGLGLPAPELLAFLAGWTELLGGFLLLFGLATRLISLPLIFTMIIAATTAHWHNGWFAIAPSNPSSSAAQPLAWIGIEAAEESLENSVEVGRRVRAMKSLLETHGNTDWLYAKGSIAVLNNGIEFAVTYLIMLLVLLFHGPGRWVSADHWIRTFLAR
ncbi:DoxX family protein [Pseudomaricurvus alkylphenolicus]|uniref:HvfX family Cu-binding RiPP maturation protein n=1 Tax=Pseudomaricurvus alkylphenolicus TaxID=1306991 RepID=UPI0030B89C8F